MVEAPPDAAPGETIVAQVSVEGAVEFDACNYDVAYDPAVLEIVGGEGSREGVAAGAIEGTEIPVDMWGFIPAGEPGRLRVIQNIPGVGGVSGSGPLARLRFRVVGEVGDATVIALHEGTLSDVRADQIPATWIGVSLRVAGGEPATPGQTERSIASASSAAAAATAGGRDGSDRAINAPFLWLALAAGVALIGGVIVFLRTLGDEGEIA
jgi:hypothetical protein